MRAQIFDRIKRIMCIFFTFCFLVSIAAASVSASQKDFDRGFEKGYDAGYNAGYKQCQSGQTAAVASIKGTAGQNDYTRGYAEGYDSGFQKGLKACPKPTGPKPPVAAFSATYIKEKGDRSNKPVYLISKTIKFTDKSTGSPATWSWNFDDGTLDSSQQNPVHKYKNPGTYKVTLKVSNSAGSDEISKSVRVAVLPTLPK